MSTESIFTKEKESAPNFIKLHDEVNESELHIIASASKEYILLQTVQGNTCHTFKANESRAKVISAACQNFLSGLTLNAEPADKDKEIEKLKTELEESKKRKAERDQDYNAALMDLSRLKAENQKLTEETTYLRSTLQSISDAKQKIIRENQIYDESNKNLQRLMSAAIEVLKVGITN